LDRPELIVGSVEDVLPHPGVGSVGVAGGALDLGAIEGCDVVVRRCCDRDLRRDISQVEVAFSQGMGGDDVPDVHDRCGHDVVEALAFEEPTPPVLAEVGEWFAADQLQRGDHGGDGAVRDRVVDGARIQGQQGGDLGSVEDLAVAAAQLRPGGDRVAMVWLLMPFRCVGGATEWLCRCLDAAGSP